MRIGTQIKAEEVKRSKSINIKLTDSERIALIEAAAKAGCDVSKFVRGLIFTVKKGS